MDILNKIREVGLKGCGGAAYPTADKWQAVKDSFAPRKYVICNASEGEPFVYKDGYIFKNWPEKVIAGIDLAIKFLTDRKVEVEGYVFINHEYAKKYGRFLAAEIQKRNSPISIYVKPENGGYICGEETVILNTIEGEKSEPRLKPPFPTTRGLWGEPTIINNVETFYHIARIAEGDYETVRFYSINGDCRYPGVYKMRADKTIKHILAETRNWLPRDFFVQVGGGSAGEILNNLQLDCLAVGAMSLTLYQAGVWKARDLFRHWIGFFLTESCGQCTTCREGTYRLFEVINSKNPDWKLFFDLLDNLSETSLCGLGLSVPTAIKSYIKNVLLDKNFDVKDDDKKAIAKYFK